jgi:hypothetical protein
VLTQDPLQDNPKSNKQLLDDLASGAGLAPKTAQFIGTQITWWDSMDDKGYSGMMTPSKPTVRGGRLGTDAEHTVEDVPNHYVRDRIMDYINEEVKASKRDQARRAVFSDLPEGDITRYSALVAAERESERIDASVVSSSRPAKKRRDAVHMETGRAGKRPKIVKNRKEAVSVLEQEMVVAEIAEVDLGSRPHCGIRDDYQTECSKHSLIQPGLKCRLPTERSLKPDARIDRDCDQVRTLIKRYTTEGSEWSLDDFRMALGSVERWQLAAFMEKSGPDAGKQSTVYPLAWDFFNLREQIGLPLLSRNPPLDRSSPPHTVDPMCRS